FQASPADGLVPSLSPHREQRFVGIDKAVLEVENVDEVGSTGEHCFIEPGPPVAQFQGLFRAAKKGGCRIGHKCMSDSLSDEDAAWTPVSTRILVRKGNHPVKISRRWKA